MELSYIIIHKSSQRNKEKKKVCRGDNYVYCTQYLVFRIRFFPLRMSHHQPLWHCCHSVGLNYGFMVALQKSRKNRCQDAMGGPWSSAFRRPRIRSSTSWCQIRSNRTGHTRSILRGQLF